MHAKMRHLNIFFAQPQTPKRPASSRQSRPQPMPQSPRTPTPMRKATPRLMTAASKPKEQQTEYEAKKLAALLYIENKKLKRKEKRWLQMMNNPAVIRYPAMVRQAEDDEDEDEDEEQIPQTAVSTRSLRTGHSNRSDRSLKTGYSNRSRGSQSERSAVRTARSTRPVKSARGNRQLRLASLRSGKFLLNSQWEKPPTPMGARILPTLGEDKVSAISKYSNLRI